MRFQRRLLLPLMASAAMAFATVALALPKDDYCAGFNDGYRAGYWQTSGVDPSTSSMLCRTVPPRKAEETRSEYDRGYDKGFKEGAREGSRPRPG